MDFIERVGWQQYLAFLTEGEPSIAIQLAIVNSALLVYWVLRRARTRTKVRPNEWLLPVMFTACNLAVLTLGDRIAV